MDSERQVHSESVVKLGHEIERDNTDHVARPFNGVEFRPGLARRVAVFGSGLWDEFDEAVLGAQRFLQPGRWC